MKVHHWDEIVNEVGRLEVPGVSWASSSEEVYNAFNLIIEPPADPDEPRLTTQLGSLTLIVGRFDRGHKYMMWWGPGAEEFTKTIEGLSQSHEEVEG